MFILRFSFIARTRNDCVGGFQRSFLNRNTGVQVAADVGRHLPLDRAERVAGEDVRDAELFFRVSRQDARVRIVCMDHVRQAIQRTKVGAKRFT